jgi:hypothetical protein
MNTFSKLTVSVLLLGITPHVFSQEMLYKSYPKVDLPFYDGGAVRSFLKRQTVSDTLWLPAIVLNQNGKGLSAPDYYEYHENGLLKKVTGYSPEGDYMGFYSYNNTYIDPLMDVLDTLFHNHTDPPYRCYYNNRQADSSYWEEYYQTWDGEKWNTKEKTYVHLLDTATVSEFQDHIEIFDGNGNITTGQKAFLTFDEQGNVSEAIVEFYDVDTKQYQIAYKYVYLYDENGQCHTRNGYYSSSGTWKWGNRLADMNWFEFHGFDNGDILFYGRPSGLYEHYSPKNKNKISDLKFLTLSDGVPTLLSIDTIKWNLEPFSYNYFGHMGYNRCLDTHQYYEYNEHDHLTSEGRHDYAYWNCETTTPYGYVIIDYINKYDDRDRRYEYTLHNTYLSEDSLYQATLIFVVDSFTYVIRPVGIDELPVEKHTLLIVPNPADETVRITATDSIAAITLYASDGRLAYSQEGSGKETIVNLRGLSKGIYLVQARLKDGGVQTGKVVVR